MTTKNEPSATIQTFGHVATEVYVYSNIHVAQRAHPNVDPEEFVDAGGGLVLLIVPVICIAEPDVPMVA